MSRLAVAAIALTALAGIAAAALLSRPQAPPEPLSDTPAQRDEAPALAASNGLVWRDGPALSLRLKSGEVLTLTDRITCGDLPCPIELSAQYRYRGWDEATAAYKLWVAPSGGSPDMLVPFTEDANLFDARQIEPSTEKPTPLPMPPAATGPDPDLAEWLADIASERTHSEAPKLAAAAGKAVRDGAKLSLALRDGRHLVLTDDLACGQLSCPPTVFRSFDYAGLSPDGRFHVIEEHWDEANAAMLVDVATGSIEVLLGPPKFSPDGKRLAAAVSDLESSAPRRLEVWNLTSAVPGVEYSLPGSDDDDTIYDIVAWVDADHLRLRRGPWDSKERTPAMLVRNGGGWHIEVAN
ncbi:MAG TPA: hypothetical protein VK558_16395 [Patescibacteria group bacterium]|nr:hypothetical protein [Patescibacteria group bacterium]